MYLPTVSFCVLLSYVLLAYFIRLKFIHYHHFCNNMSSVVTNIRDDIIACYVSVIIFEHVVLMIISQS